MSRAWGAWLKVWASVALLGDKDRLRAEGGSLQRAASTGPTHCWVGHSAHNYFAVNGSYFLESGNSFQSSSDSDFSRSRAS